MSEGIITYNKVNVILDFQSQTLKVSTVKGLRQSGIAREICQTIVILALKDASKYLFSIYYNNVHLWVFEYII